MYSNYKPEWNPIANLHQGWTIPPKYTNKKKPKISSPKLDIFKFLDPQNKRLGFMFIYVVPLFKLYINKSLNFLNGGSSK